MSEWDGIEIDRERMSKVYRSQTRMSVMREMLPEPATDPGSGE